MKVGVQRDCGVDPSVAPAQTSGICECDLRAQNRAFYGTGGVSRNNRFAGFVPAYFNHETGESIVSVFADGRIAPVHVLDGLPESWISDRDSDGTVLRTRDTIEAGFLRNGRFYSREAAAQAIADES